MTVFTRVHLVSENPTVTVRRDDKNEYLVISAGATDIIISGPGYVGRQIQDAIASAYAELRRADEAEQFVANATVEVENYGGTE